MPADTSCAERKPIEYARPGWWVQAFDDDGADMWVRVYYVASVTHVETGRKATVLRAVDREGVGIEMREWSGTPVTRLTAKQAKRAGLEGGEVVVSDPGSGDTR